MVVSLRTKLVVSFLAVIIICGLVATVVAIRLIGTGIISQAQDKVRIDLNSARFIYQDEIRRTKDLLRITANRFFIKNAILNRDIEMLTEQLEEIRKTESLDILTLTDKNGRVIIRSRNPSVSGDSQANDELVSRILSGIQVIGATEIVAREDLIKEGADLAKQAYIKFVPTPKAKPTKQTEQTSAMCIKAAVSVVDYDGNQIGVLYGGNLLNKNHKIVDKVKEIVYQGVKYKNKDIGTATIFQGDLRISTNVKQADGSRAIGTRVSQEVYEQVLEKGLPWIDRAFVVNNWYIAAYEPIKNINEKIIGVLYVGILEEKFMDMRNEAIVTFLGIMLAGMVMALVVSGFLTKSVSQPIKHLIFASSRWAKGDLDYQVKTTRKDEIAKLAETFNSMAISLKERDNKLKEYTSQQIMKSERLATLGQLAAGVAHEINNPLGGILMYTHLALEDLDKRDVLRANLEKAVIEATRCKDIVKRLLDFARQTKPKVEQSDVNKVLERTLDLVKNQVLFHNVKIIRSFSSLPAIFLDAGQIQQVFTNIILNAAEAMEGKGELTVVTKMSSDNEYVEISFTDTGCGISPEDCEKIFDPFFTTKEVGHGTGLGLAVSHGIVAGHKGTIEVKSEQGKGSCFAVRLPLKRKEN